MRSKDIGKIHWGFMKALGLHKFLGWPKDIESQGRERVHPLAYYSLREKLRELMKESERARCVVTGHSLGGALAILFPSILAFHEEKLLLEKLDHRVYTFGQHLGLEMQNLENSWCDHSHNTTFITVDSFMVLTWSLDCPLMTRR
uniref:Fungal lipase-type domain-containing protein n=1 Tax=Cucumis melo TaxID=3656 RepID=A0A9I9EFZ6_CUCME